MRFLLPPWLLLPFLVAGSAWGSMWVDPEWEELLGSSDVIVLAEVATGGEFEATVRSVRTFKGNPPKTLRVEGFNNQHWPDHAIEKESFKKGESYVLFLKGRTDGGYALPSPSCGDIPVREGKARYTVLTTSYPSSQEPRDINELFTFLDAVAGGSSKGKEALTSEIVAALQDTGENEKKECAENLAMYRLLGETAFLEQFESIAKEEDPAARLMLARLLGNISDPRASRLLNRMGNDRNSVVQGEVIRQIKKSGGADLGEQLLKRLPGSQKGGAGPSNLMDPVRNELSDGQTEIIEALAELKYKKAIPALKKLMQQSSDVHEALFIAGALEQIGDKSYGPILAPFLRNEESRDEVAQFVEEYHVPGITRDLERALSKVPAEEFRFDGPEIVDALVVVGDAKTAFFLDGRLKARLRTPQSVEYLDREEYVSYIRALAAFRHEPGRRSVYDALFFWCGVDDSFVASAKLLPLKREFEKSLEARVRAALPRFKDADIRCVAFLQNRKELAGEKESRPKFDSIVEVNIRSQDFPNETWDKLRDRLCSTLEFTPEQLRVSRWKGEEELVTRVIRG